MRPLVFVRHDGGKLNVGFILNQKVPDHMHLKYNPHKTLILI